MSAPSARARHFVLSFLAVVALVAGVISVPALTGTPLLPAAQAAGSPDVQLTRTVAAQTLYGKDVSVSLTAKAPNATPDVDGFNLTFSDVLPSGASITSSNFPVSDKIVQLDGTTLVIWTNVADLLDNASVTLTYTFGYPVLGQTGARDVGDTFSGTAHAYVNTDPYTVPNPAATPVDGSVWEDVSGSASATSSTQLVPYTVKVRELLSPESELLRGIHQDKTVYEIVVTNNTVAPTTNPDVTAYLPANLEFLGCAASDNSAAPEYAGAPALSASFPSVTSCDPQYTATTVSADPGAAGSNAVFTKVLWDQLADLTPSAVVTLRYAAAIPLHANVLNPAVTNPVANLDNNTGAEADDEQKLTTWVSGTGDYKGGKPAATGYVVQASSSVSAEDVRIVKSVSTDAINQQANSTWTLDLATSEYTQSTGAITVTDVIPDGLDYVSSSLAPTSVAPPAADGTITVVWTVPSMATQDTAQITYQTKTRHDYRNDGKPVSANDTWTNVVDLTTSTVLRSGATGQTTRNVATVIDHSEAGQHAEPIVENKQIGVPVGGSCTAVTTWLEDSVADFHPGDTVCFRLDVDFPDHLDTVQAKISDYLPAGFTLVGQPYYNTPLHDLGDSTALHYQKNAAGTVLTWDKDEVDLGTYFSAIITTTVGTSTQKTDIVGNLMKVRYENTPGSTFQLRDQANAGLSAPLLSLTKTVVSPASGTVQAGDPIQYKITVSNSGSEDATQTEVRDVLPASWTCAQITSETPAADACASGTATWTGVTVPANGSVSFVVNAVAPVTAAPGDSYTNHAGVRSYDGANNTATATVYYPKNNIDPTVTPNTDPADATATVTVAGGAITKTAASLAEGGNNSGSQATIGEVVTFTVTATIPRGTTMYGSPSVTDTVDARYALIAGSATYTVNTGSGAGSAQNATVAGQALSIPLGPVDGGDSTTYVNPTGSGDDTIVLTYQARVLDTAANTKALGSIPNSATLSWQTSAAAPRSTSASANVTVVEPNITIAKTANKTTATPDDTVTYTLTVTNPTATNVSTAHEIDVVDTVPAQLTPLTTGGAAAADGDTLLNAAGVLGNGVWHSTGRTVTFPQIATMAPGATAVAYTFQVKVQNPLLTPGTVTNSVTATGTSLTGAATGERTSTSPVTAGYTSTATRPLNAPALSMTKSPSPTVRTVGEKVTYTLKVTIPAGTYAYDVLIRDTLATGIRYFGDPITVSCDQGGSACSPAQSATVIGAPTQTDATVGFWLGDITAGTASRVVTIQYTGIVTTTAATGSQVNTARLYSHSTDLVTGTPATLPAATGYNVISQPTGTVTVQRPVLAIVKKVNGVDSVRAKPGQVLHYTLVVTNSGTSPAYDLTVTDTPNPAMTNYTPVTMTGATAVDTDPSDGTLSWTVAGPIAAGASITLAYDLTAPASWTETNEVVAGYELTNVADVPSYYGVPSASRTLASTYYANYNDVPADQADVELDLASVGDRVWFDVDGDGVQDAGEPGIPGVQVSVLFAGADGTFGTGDDETVSTTTDATGAWLVSNLPGGSYRVSVKTADLPAGVTPSYDKDGIATPSLWTGTLAQNGAPRDIDFGYTGTGSIGDRVWFDQDADGVQDAGEPGIPGRTVTLIWAGIDDMAGTSDDVTYTATTGANGVYTVPLLAAGHYRVTVSGMPAGYGSTFDPDGTPDGTAKTTLTAGQVRTDQDFGYAGTGSIGDLIWIDRDENGVFDAAGATPEQGVAGATVALDWHGVGGSATDPVLGTFTTTTGATGLYSFDHLVPGTYTVRVTGSLPLASDNTHDRDGNKDSKTDVVIAAGDIVTDADFGYSSDSSLGQRVWWDRDGDGVQDAGEPGFSGVGITVLYFGPDGIEGNADDRTFTTTTGTDGAWSLGDLPEGKYRVTADASDLPAGLSQTYDADGLGSANTSVTTLGTGSVLTQNFGYRGAGSLGDLVFLDRDADGVQDAQEPGLAGVTVTLQWNGFTVGATTAADGSYSFAGLAPGDYTVAVATGSLPSASLSAVSDLEGSQTDASADLTLGSGEHRTDADFGFRGAASIGDQVWNDRDADGVLGSDESGIPGVTVTAVWAGRDGVSGTADDVTLTTVTDADGTYAFDHLPAGDWTVSISNLPSGFTAATYEEDGTLDNSDVVTLGSTAHDTADFGVRGTGSIGDRIWLDRNGDGAQDAGEPGIQGQDVTLYWAGPNGVYGDGDDETWTTTTGADGAWIVKGLPDGAFRAYVTHGIVDIASPTGDPDGVLDSKTNIALTSAHRVHDTADFGYLGARQLGDTVWWDENEDGVVDPSETLLPGVTVDLVWAGLDGTIGTSDDLAFTTTTGAAGDYLFTGLPDGTYTVTAASGVPAGLDPVSDPDSGAADGTSTVTITSDDLTQDFGFAGSGSIGDRVWLDLSGDGTDDAGEPGIPGVLATLTWGGVDGVFGDGDDRTWTDTASSTGAYLFDGLPAGDFRVDLSGLPAGLAGTADPDGLGTADTALLTLASGAADLAQDFGYTGTASLGDTVWVDLNANAVQDGAEPGLPGVVVTVRLAGADSTLGTGDDILLTRTTDASGQYTATGLPAGPVEVSYDPAALDPGYLASSDRDGADAADTVLTLATGDAITDVDFAIAGDAKLHGVVFDDKNGNGTRNKGEKGVAGVTITIEWDGPTGAILFTAITDAKGEWMYSQLPPGAYVSEIDGTTIPRGYRIDTERIVTRSIAVGGNAFVIMGITNAALAFTGQDPRTNIVVGLLALLLGLGVVLVARRVRPNGARHRA